MRSRPIPERITGGCLHGSGFTWERDHMGAGAGAHMLNSVGYRSAVAVAQ